MEYNKNRFSKVNDKKLLHKVKKQWIIVSTALLLTLGGSVAINATAHASTDTNLNKSQATNSNVTHLNRASKSVSQSQVTLQAKSLHQSILNNQKNNTQANSKFTNKTPKLKLNTYVSSINQNFNIKSNYQKQTADYNPLPRYDNKGHETIYLNTQNYTYPYVINGHFGDTVHLPGSNQIVKFGKNGQLLDDNNNPYHVLKSFNVNGTQIQNNSNYYYFSDNQFEPQYISYQVTPKVIFYNRKNYNRLNSDDIYSSDGKPSPVTIDGYIGEPYRIDASGNILSQYNGFRNTIHTDNIPSNLQDYPLYAIINPNRNNNNSDSWINNRHTFSQVSQSAKPIIINYLNSDGNVCASQTYPGKNVYDKLTSDTVKNDFNKLRISNGNNIGDKLSQYYSCNIPNYYYYKPYLQTYNLMLNYKPLSIKVPVYLQKTNFFGVPQDTTTKADINISGTYNQWVNESVSWIKNHLQSNVFNNHNNILFTSPDNSLSVRIGTNKNGQLGHNNYYWNTLSNQSLTWKNGIPVIDYFDKASIPKPPAHHGGSGGHHHHLTPNQNPVNSGDVNESSDNNIVYNQEVRDGVPYYIENFRPTSLSNPIILNNYKRFLNGDKDLANNVKHSRDEICDTANYSYRDEADLTIWDPGTKPGHTTGAKILNKVPVNSVISRSSLDAPHEKGHGISIMMTKQGPRMIKNLSDGSPLLATGTFAPWDKRVNNGFASGFSYNSVTGQTGQFVHINLGNYKGKIAMGPQYQVYKGYMGPNLNYKNTDTFPGNNYFYPDNSNDKITQNSKNQYYVFYPKGSPMLATYSQGIDLSYYKGKYYNTQSGKEVTFQLTNRFINKNNLPVIKSYDGQIPTNVSFIDSTNNHVISQTGVQNLPEGLVYLKYDVNTGKVYIWTYDKSIDMNKADKFSYGYLTGPSSKIQETLLSKPAGYTYDSDATNKYYRNATPPLGYGNVPNWLISAFWTIGDIPFGDLRVYLKPTSKYIHINHNTIGPNQPGILQAIQVDNNNNVIKHDKIYSNDTRWESNPVYMPNFSTLQGSNAQSEKNIITQGYQKIRPKKFDYEYDDYHDGHNYLINTIPVMSNNGMTATWYYRERPFGAINVHYINANGQENHPADTFYGYTSKGEDLNDAINNSQKTLYSYYHQVPDYVTIDDSSKHYNLSDVANNNKILTFNSVPSTKVIHNIYVHYEPATIYTTLIPTVILKDYNGNSKYLKDTNNIIQLSGVDKKYNNKYYRFYDNPYTLPSYITGKDGSIYKLIEKQNVSGQYDSVDDKQNGTNDWISKLPIYIYQANQGNAIVKLHDVSGHHPDESINIPIDANAGSNNNLGYKKLPSKYIPSDYQISKQNNEYLAKYNSTTTIDIAPNELWDANVKVENADESTVPNNIYDDTNVSNAINNASINYISNKNYQVSLTLPKTITDNNGVVYYLQSNPVIKNQNYSYNYTNNQWQNNPTYIYKAIGGKVTIKYYDNNTNSVISDYSHNGNYGSDLSYNPSNEINKLTSKGYKLVTNNYPTKYAYGNNSNKIYYIYFTHQFTPVSQNITGTENIIYSGAGSKTPKTYTKTINLFTRTGNKDNVTNNIQYNIWQKDNNTFNSVNVPNIDGYSIQVTNGKYANNQIMPPNTNNVIVANGKQTYNIYVTYLKNGGVQFRYLDADNNNNLIYTDPKTYIGVSGSKDNYNAGNKLNSVESSGIVNKNYTLKSPSNISFTYGNKSQIINVYLQHKTSVLSHKYTEHVSFLNSDNSQAYAPIDRIANVIKTTDLVNGESITTGAIPWNSIIIPHRNDYVWTASGDYSSHGSNQATIPVYSPTRNINIIVRYSRPEINGVKVEYLNQNHSDVVSYPVTNVFLKKNINLHHLNGHDFLNIAGDTKLRGYTITPGQNSIKRLNSINNKIIPIYMLGNKANLTMSFINSDNKQIDYDNYNGTNAIGDTISNIKIPKGYHVNTAKLQLKDNHFNYDDNNHLLNYTFNPSDISSDKLTTINGSSQTIEDMKDIPVPLSGDNAAVNIKYINSDGDIINKYQLNGQMGKSNILNTIPNGYAINDNQPNKYEFSPSQIKVHYYNDDLMNDYNVYVHKSNQFGILHVVYLNQNGQRVGKMSTIRGRIGDKVNVTDKNIGGESIPNGYALDSNENINNFITKPDSTVYLRVHGLNITTNVKVIRILEDNKKISTSDTSATVSGNSGDVTNLSANKNNLIPHGYHVDTSHATFAPILISSDKRPVVVFYYQVNNQIGAPITVNYINHGQLIKQSIISGGFIGSNQTNGKTTSSDIRNDVPTNYSLTNSVNNYNFSKYNQCINLNITGKSSTNTFLVHRILVDGHHMKRSDIPVTINSHIGSDVIINPYLTNDKVFTIHGSNSLIPQNYHPGESNNLHLRVGYDKLPQINYVYYKNYQPNPIKTIRIHYIDTSNGNSEVDEESDRGTANDSFNIKPYTEDIPEVPNTNYTINDSNTYDSSGNKIDCPTSFNFRDNTYNIYLHVKSNGNNLIILSNN